MLITARLPQALVNMRSDIVLPACVDVGLAKHYASTFCKHSPDANKKLLFHTRARCG